MPLFFLDVQNTEIQSKDPDGLELHDLEAARQAAVEGIRSILAEEVLSGKLDLRGEIRIEDEHGDVVLVVPYALALDIET